MKNTLITFLLGGQRQSQLEDIGKLTLRLLFGLSLALHHGFPTFKGALGGAANFPDPLGLGPEFSMLLAGSAEFIFALLVVTGICTRFSLIPVLLNFSVALLIFHADDPFARKEMAYLYLSAMTAIMLLGPGKFSLDYWLFEQTKT